MFWGLLFTFLNRLWIINPFHRLGNLHRFPTFFSLVERILGFIAAYTVLWWFFLSSMGWCWICSWGFSEVGCFGELEYAVGGDDWTWILSLGLMLCLKFRGGYKSVAFVVVLVLMFFFYFNVRFLERLWVIKGILLSAGAGNWLWSCLVYGLVDLNFVFGLGALS